MEHNIRINTEACIGCGACERDCPEQNIVIKDHCAVLIAQNCLACGHCEAICPKNAITMEGYADEVEYVDVIPPISAQQVLHAIKSRRSIRQFKTSPIEDVMLKNILEAGRFTPTAKNKQGVSYIVLQDKKKEIEEIAVRLFKKLWPLASLYNKAVKHVELDEHFFFKNAPIVILVIAQGNFAKVDGSLAASNMALMAEAQGLGVLYSGFFTIAANMSRNIKRKLQLKRKDRVIMTLVIGKPNVRYVRTAHRNKANVHYF